MSFEKYQELLQLSESSEKAAWIIIALEFTSLFAAGKAISSMWNLILTAQFLVYMSQWEIMQDETSGVVLKKLR